MRSILVSGWFWTAILVVLAGAPTRADEGDSSAVDTTLYSPSENLAGYIPVSDPEDTELRIPQNPTVALFKSMAVPGWGQIGNKKYTKAGVYIALEAFFVVLALDYRSQANGFYDQYLEADTLSVKNYYHSLYEEKKNKRNRYTWFTVITIFISMFDAYVDAHLAGFPYDNKNSDLGLDVGPSEQYDFGAALRFRF